MNEIESKKQILKSSSIIGGASVITILVGLIKVKILALLLGPTGVGFFGIYTSVLALGSSIFGFGLVNAGVREISLQINNINYLNQVRIFLKVISIFLGVIAILVIYSLRDEISSYLFNSKDEGIYILVLGLGIFFSLQTNVQLILLQGFRKIKEQAKLKIFSSLISTVIGIAIIYIYGVDGLAWAVIIVPATNYFIGVFYVKKNIQIKKNKPNLSTLCGISKNILYIGFIFMISGIMGEATKLGVREIIVDNLGINASGYFQASWQISMTYISFILGAMVADYYPRLTQSIGDKEKAHSVVNHQTEIALVFSSPIILCMLTFAPIIVKVLYSNDFYPSIEILRWQSFGDVLKILSWPLGFLLLAKGKTKSYFLIEMVWNISYFIFVYYGLKKYGIEVTGYCFVLSYFIYTIILFAMVNRECDFKWNIKVKKEFFLSFIFSILILLLSYYNIYFTSVFGLIAIIITSYSALKTLKEMGVNNKITNKAYAILKI
ncbi:MULTISPECIES: O-antigen translocase [unclassified Photobacterium]|uniref:O-antigen translocase n=1 Tax=unclassified Photobacterium TaxID=2628852 RepID=UPI001EDFBBA4|nr:MULTISPECIES: O-antigen translocase [unclassified Photobacterium]MCG3864088.1 O-antigen translocase [Photobacterium sp. Ph6]MCG3875618.1 O-antigen translocase [Photobacterium sp. Ph5]